MIVGLNGFKGSGKNVAAEHIAKVYGFEHVSFAGLLKESAAALFELKPTVWEEWKNDSTMEVLVQRRVPNTIPHVRLTVRQFLQRYGTEAHRDIFGENFWVEQLFDTMDMEKNYVISDARFESELLTIKKYGGININIYRGESDDPHPSEATPPEDLIDYWITNNGTLLGLYSIIETIMEDNFDVVV